jgi:hypothetical protein
MKPSSDRAKAMYKIEKGIPIPSARLGRHTGLINSLREMDVGDSVLVEGVTPAQLGGMNISRMRKEGRRFVKRRVEGASLFMVSLARR